MILKFILKPTETYHELKEYLKFVIKSIKNSNSFKLFK